MLQEKLLRLKAEIALVDENIFELKVQATQKMAQPRKTGENNQT
jgi:hypothetical protein